MVTLISYGARGYKDMPWSLIGAEAAWLLQYQMPGGASLFMDISSSELSILLPLSSPFHFLQGERSPSELAGRLHVSDAQPTEWASALHSSCHNCREMNNDISNYRTVIPPVC